MRDRLIELVDYGSNDYASYSTEMAQAGNYGMESMGEFIADKILADGWMRPPVKMRTKVYKIVLGKIYEYEVASYTVDADGFSFIHLAYMEGNTLYGATHSIEEFNKQYYITKEEAEQALKVGVRE